MDEDLDEFVGTICSGLHTVARDSLYGFSNENPLHHLTTNR